MHSTSDTVTEGCVETVRDEGGAVPTLKGDCEHTSSVQTLAAPPPEEAPGIDSGLMGTNRELMPLVVGCGIETCGDD